VAADAWAVIPVAALTQEVEAEAKPIRAAAFPVVDKASTVARAAIRAEENVYSGRGYSGGGQQFYSGRGFSGGGGGYNTGRFYAGRGYYYGGRFWARPYFGVGIGIPFGFGYYTDRGCGYYDGYGYWQPAPCYSDSYSSGY